MHFYAFSGLSVASEIALPGMIAHEEDAAPDVTIRRRPVPLALTDAGMSGPTWQIAGRQLLLCIPDIARFLMTEGREIAVEPAPSAAPGDIPAFILGGALGILLHQRERIVLQASAVRVNGKAVLLCGASGAGKSTLAAALGSRGYALLSDDICAVTVDDAGGPTAHADGHALKLWAHSIDRLKLMDRRGDRVRARLEKFYVAPDESFGDALPLGAVYVLREARPPHAAGIERPNIVDATLLLRRAAYRPLLVARLDQRAAYFRAAAAIANRAGIFHLTRPLDFAALPSTLAALERHWLDVGLMETAA